MQEHRPSAPVGAPAGRPSDVAEPAADADTSTPTPSRHQAGDPAPDAADTSERPTTLARNEQALGTPRDDTEQPPEGREGRTHPNRDRGGR